jgi:hypothetical protein
LLSKLFANELRPILFGLSLAEFKPVRGCNEDLRRSDQQLVVDEHATKFSNFQLETIELGAKKLVEWEELEGSNTYDQSQIV